MQLPTKRRKVALQDTAYQYAKARVLPGDTLTLTRRSEIADGFEDGYRAAMKDARSVWRRAGTLSGRVADILQFLRPLR